MYTPVIHTRQLTVLTADEIADEIGLCAEHKADHYDRALKAYASGEVVFVSWMDEASARFIEENIDEILRGMDMTREQFDLVMSDILDSHSKQAARALLKDISE